MGALGLCSAAELKQPTLKKEKETMTSLSILNSMISISELFKVTIQWMAKVQSRVDSHLKHRRMKNHQAAMKELASMPLTSSEDIEVKHDSGNTFRILKVTMNRPGSAAEAIADAVGPRFPIPKPFGPWASYVQGDVDPQEGNDRRPASFKHCPEAEISRILAQSGLSISMDTARLIAAKEQSPAGHWKFLGAFFRSALFFPVTDHEIPVHHKKGSPMAKTPVHITGLRGDFSPTLYLSLYGKGTVIYMNGI